MTNVRSENGLDELLSKHAIELPFSSRARYHFAYLVSYGAVWTFGQAARIPRKKFLDYNRVGEHTFADLCDALTKVGLSHGMNAPVGPLEERAIASFRRMKDLDLSDSALHALLMERLFTLEDLAHRENRYRIIFVLQHKVPKSEPYYSIGWDREIHTGKERYEDLLARIEAHRPKG